ncbi:MAG: polysaccharide deacetylase [Gemmatimonadota bacterium]
MRLLVCTTAVLSGMLAVTACEKTPGPAPRAAAAADTVPAWRWSMDTIRTVVNAVRAGRSLVPTSWPGGARVAVLLSFDVDNETIPLRFGQPTVGELSQGQYGARVGLRRITDLLARYRIPATFFIPAVSLLITPGMVDMIKRSGDNEFAVHGWIHERNTAVPAAEERELIKRAVDTLTKLTGSKPVGYRAPSWNFSPATMSIVKDLGFLYESSLMADDGPYELIAAGAPSGVIELPVEWILDDAPLFSPLGNAYSPPREVLGVWKDEFDKAYQEGGMFLLTMHPHISGHRSRIVALEGLISYIRSKPGVWFGTHRAAAEFVAPLLKTASP